jgi:copper transport protein
VRKMFTACALVMGVAISSIAIPASVSAHLGLKSSKPAKGDSIRDAVSTIELTFTQRMELRYTTVFVVTARGDTVRADVFAADTLGRAISARLQHPLLDGSYTVHWRTAGPDGHMVSGNYGFTVFGMAPLPPPTVPPATPLELPPPGDVLPQSPGDVNLQPIAVLERWLRFTLALLLIGGAVFQLLLRKLGTGSEYWRKLSDGARRVSLLAALASVALALPRIALQSSAMNGAGHGWDFSMWGPLIRETNWGRGWLLQTLGSGGYLMAAFAATVEVAAPWLLSAAATVIIAFGIAFSGHAAAFEQMQIINIGNDAVHVLAVGAWLGTLAYVVSIAVPTGIRLQAYAEVASLVRVFSPLALGAAAIAIVTGSVSALSHIGPLTDLLGTSYGRMLSLKLIGVAAVAAGGYYNWKKMKPELGSSASTAQLRRSARAEIGFALLVLLATAILVALPTP